jgi:hypothetical protein
MVGPIPTGSGRIFISYRREETSYPAAWLYDRLAERFGGGQVFKDVDSIQLGDDFVEVIQRAVGSCDVLLALIGDQWLTITDQHGRRRLDNPDDFVRLEIEAALTRNVRVIPILVEGAPMPPPEELPESLTRLVRRQALELSPERFEFDTNRLHKVLETTLDEVRRTQEDATSQVAPAAPATSDGGPPRARGSPPEGTRRGRFTRTRVLAGVGVAVAQRRRDQAQRTQGRERRRSPGGGGRDHRQLFVDERRQRPGPAGQDLRRSARRGAGAP